MSCDKVVTPAGPPKDFDALDLGVSSARSRRSDVDYPARFGVGSELLGIVDRDVQVASRWHSEADESMRRLPVVKAARLQRGHLVEPLVVDRKR
jgi:hypothetical protein